MPTRRELPDARHDQQHLPLGMAIARPKARRFVKNITNGPVWDGPLR